MQLRVSIGFWLILSFALPLFAYSPADKAAQEVKVLGRVVCADDAVPVGDCSSAPESLAFKTTEGKIFRYLKENPSNGILGDPRVRARDLHIIARLHPEDRLEIIKVHSVHDSKIFDLYYFCEVCNITLYAPGLCPCCRQELEFKEVPLDKQ